MHKIVSTAHCTRRVLVSAGISLLGFAIGGCEGKLTPAPARAGKGSLRTLTAAEAHTLEVLGEILVPGSVEAGLVRFIDHQLSGTPASSMLMLKYLGVSAPFAHFYKSGLANAENAARTAYSKSLGELDGKQGQALLVAMAQGQLEGWSDPPAALFYFTVRNDAVDVVYGVQAGFERLGVPYMPHIVPPSQWGE